MTLDSCVRPFSAAKASGFSLSAHDALDDAGAVAKNREEQLAGFAHVVEPAADGDFLAVVFAGFFDGNNGHWLMIPKLAKIRARFLT